MIKTADNLEYVFSEEHLMQSWHDVAIKKAAPGIDNITVDIFARNPLERIRRIHDLIVSNRYNPQPLILFHKEKKNSSFRTLTIPTISDKIVARTAAGFELRRYQNIFAPQSYAYRPHRGALKAVSVVEEKVKDPNVRYVARIDIRDFFDTIDHKLLRNMLIGGGTSENLTRFIMMFADNPRFDGTQIITPHTGVPQGSPLAPVLSNIYLDYFDKEMNKTGISFLRYADDIIIFGRNSDEAGNHMNYAIKVLETLKLDVSIDKTRIYSTDSGFIFLGFFFNKNGKVPSSDSVEHLNEMLESPKYDDETESEYNKRLEAVLRGWKNYFEHENKKADSEPYTAEKNNEVKLPEPPDIIEPAYRSETSTLSDLSDSETDQELQ
jgi:group II intron reverse transcriptase/maturase